MTNNSMDDFDERIHRAASEYNKPGDVPRDRMWSEIQARRARRSTAVDVAASRKRPLWYIPIAAAAVLVLGIAIGRVYERFTATPASVAIAPSKPDSQQTFTPQSPAHDSVEPRPSNPAAVEVATAPAPDTRRPTPITPRPAPRTPPEQPFVGNSASMAYRLAVVEHLAGTEAMLSSFRAAAKRGEVDAQITTWARNLLTTTRLLQGSVGQEDPTMKRLLDDLELVLVQIAQYTSAGPHRAEELELIEHSIERRGVIGKLHTNIPARLAPAGT